MTVTLHLTPEVEAGLLARAQASGMALEEYLLFRAEEAAILTAPSPAAKMAREEAVQRMLEFGDKHHLAFGERISRKLLHETTPLSHIATI